MTQTNYPNLNDLYDAIASKNDKWSPLRLAKEYSQSLADIVLKSETQDEAVKKFRILFKEQAAPATKIKVKITVLSEDVKEKLIGNTGILPQNDENGQQIGIARARKAISKYLQHFERAFENNSIILFKTTVEDKKIPSDFEIYPLGRHMKIEIANISPNHTVGTLWRYDGNENVLDIEFDASELEQSKDELKCNVEANKAKLFFQYFLLDGKKDDRCWFLEEAINQGLKSFQALYDDSEVSKRVEEFFSKFTSSPTMADTHLKERGLLVYGPPGTGKTTIIKNMADHIGLTLVYPTFPAGAINEPHVGEAEKKVLDMFQRAREIPWLPCALVVDEIDGMAPARTGDSADHKVAVLSILLAEFGGIKDVPNMFVLGSTNRLQEMDEAFKRRMHRQIYVGVMTNSAREKFFTSILSERNNKDKRFNWKARGVGLHATVIAALQDQDIQKKLMLYTQNFNIDVMTKFMDKLLFTLKATSQVEQLLENSNAKLKELLATVLKGCISHYHLEGFSHVSKYATVQYRTQPSYVTQIQWELEHIKKDSGRNNHEKTGRMIVHPALTEKDGNKVVRVYCEGPHRKLLDYPWTSANGQFDYNYLLRAVVEAAQFNGDGTKKVDYVQQIDFLQMARAGVFEESKVAGQIQSLLDEAQKNYTRSISVIDVDQLVMVSDNSDSSDGVAPPSVMRMQVLQTIISKFNRLVNNDNIEVLNNEKKYPKHWIILIVNDKTIWRQIRVAIEWPTTEVDEAEHNQSTGKQALKECKHCGEMYTEEENKPLSCVWHNGNYGRPGGSTCTMATKHTFDDPNDEEQSSDDKNKKPKARWSCCKRVGKDAQGCLKSKHVPNEAAQSRLNTVILAKK
jgi:DNA polymerase III delta prime subunit